MKGGILVDIRTVETFVDGKKVVVPWCPSIADHATVKQQAKRIAALEDAAKHVVATWKAWIDEEEDPDGAYDLMVETMKEYEEAF